ncbi:MAG: hypothetical protein LBQ60_18925 [Bacteroidales bacterium]|jgi:hypothetical protein|nr:hypothetical protein [Bacteroidales bacterium]
MKTIKNILIILSGIFLSACHEELGYDDVPAPSSGGNSVEVTVRLNTPSGFPSRTRALTETQENEIHDAYIFGFKTGVLSYVKTIEEMTDTGNGKSFKVTLSASKDAADTYKLMILANAGDHILSLAGNDLKGLNGKTYNEVQQALLEDGISEAMFTSGGSVVMWGELPYEEIKSTNKTFSVSLVRSIARIDVGVGATGFDAGSKLATWGGLSDFVLEEVYLYKPNNAYYFVPQTGHFDEMNKVTVLPSPVGSQLSSPLIYAVSDGKSLVRNIYTVESDIRIESNAASGDKNHTNRAAIVVKGSYKGNPSSYYRLDFINSSRELINILRNHLYQFNIKSVSGNGFEDPDEAYTSLAVNMDVEVIDWNDGDIGDIVFDGQYMLGVSKGQFMLSKEQRTASDTDNRMSVITDVPGGWTIESIDDAQGDTETVSWLTVSRKSGPANSKVIVSILTEENTFSENRTGYIHIKAGRLSYKVEVIQTHQSKIDLRIMDESGIDVSELLFHSNVGGTVPAQLLNVNWLPQSTVMYVMAASVNGIPAFDFGTGDAIISGPVVGINGQKFYTIQPSAMTQVEIDNDPFMEKMLKVDFTVAHEIEYITKTLFLLQRNYAAVPKTDADYVMDGSQQYFTINANAPWSIAVVDDPGLILTQLVTTGGGANMDKRDEKVYFLPIKSTTASAGEVSLVIKSTDSRYPFPDTPVKISFIPEEATYLVNCESAVVNGVYESNIPVTGANTMTIDITAGSPGSYHIVSDVVDGLSFEASGEFLEAGTKTVTLQAKGTPVGTRTKEMTLIINSDGNQTIACTVPVYMLIPRKYILSLGSSDMAIHSALGVGQIFSNSKNFGPNASSTFKTYRPDIVPILPGLETLNVAALKPYLEPPTGKPIDIVIITYNADLSGTDAAAMLSNYVKKGGVVIMLNEHNMATTENITFLRTLFGNASITGTDDAVAAGTVLKLPEYNDPILNGPFGDIRGKYVGEDRGYADVLTTFPAEEIEWYIPSVDYSGTGGNSNQIFAFKAKNYNFFWCGDGGLLSNNDTNGYTSYPVTLTGDSRPSNRLYGRNASNRQVVDNATFFANIMAWAMQQAEFNGISTR